MTWRVLPPLLFLALAALLAVGLNLDPREVPSPLVGKSAPKFALPNLNAPENSVRPEDMRGSAWLLNVWASWCVGCRVEHDVLVRLAENHGAKIVGLNYKDAPEDAKQWLRARGDPYVFSALDAEGKAGLDWGVYAVPETFVIDSEGVIRHKHIGPLSEEDVQRDILPALEKLRGGEKA